MVIDYIELNDPPVATNESTHADWISSIDNNLLEFNRKLSGINYPGSIVPFGSYDNQVCIYFVGDEGRENPSIKIGSHEQPVLAISSFMRSDKSVEIASGSQDGQVFLWDFDLKEKANLKFKLEGHTGAVEDVSFSPSGDLIASCGWDEKIIIWNFDEDNIVDHHEVDNKKRLKKDTKANTTQIVKPLNMMEGHIQCISSLKWASEDEIITAGWDHSVRTWDVDSGVNTNQISGNKVILSLDYSSQNNLIVTGHADKTVRLWDHRIKSSEDSNLISTMLSSHTNWVSTVKWHPTNSNLLISGSYDTNIKVWDIRAKTPLHTLNNQHKDKVFALSWLNENSFVSGGADQNLRFYSFPTE